jgi:hypothetical protein
MLIDTGKRVIVLALLLLVSLASSLSMLDEPATEYVNAGMKRALTTFAIARTLNAAISLAQGTEVTAGLGAELTLSVGQVLDPINDLVESFSNLMLMASVAFGIQKVLLAIGQYHWVKWVLMALIAVWGALYAFGKKGPRWLDQVLLLMLMVRFAIPVVAVGTDAIYTHFLQKGYQQGTSGLATATTAVDGTIATLRKQSTTTTAPIPAPTPQPPTTTSSWSLGGLLDSINQKFDALLNLAKQTAQTFDPRPYLAELKAHASQATQHIIDLIVVFLLQTLVVPILLLWALYVSLKSAIASPQRR